MRRARHLLLTFVAIGSIAALVAPAGALAKGEPMGVRIQSSTADLRAGKAWDLVFTLLARPAAQRLREPAVWLEGENLEGADVFAARPTSRPGQYRASVTFPTAGQWTYTVGERYGRFFDFGPVTVRATATSHKSSSLLGTTPLTALGAICLAIACAAVARRRTNEG